MSGNDVLEGNATKEEKLGNCNFYTPILLLIRHLFLILSMFEYLHILVYYLYKA